MSNTTFKEDNQSDSSKHNVSRQKATLRLFNIYYHNCQYENKWLHCILNYVLQWYIVLSRCRSRKDPTQLGRELLFTSSAQKKIALDIYAMQNLLQVRTEVCKYRECTISFSPYPTLHLPCSFITLSKIPFYFLSKANALFNRLLLLVVTLL